MLCKKINVFYHNILRSTYIKNDKREICIILNIYDLYKYVFIIYVNMHLYYINIIHYLFLV